MVNHTGVHSIKDVLALRKVLLQFWAWWLAPAHPKMEQMFGDPQLPCVFDCKLHWIYKYKINTHYIWIHNSCVSSIDDKEVKQMWGNKNKVMQYYEDVLFIDTEHKLYITLHDKDVRQMWGYKNKVMQCYVDESFVDTEHKLYITLHQSSPT